MKKLDEIMELMADEMLDFKKDLLHFQKMTDEIKDRSIPISTEVMEKQLNFFFHQQEEREALAAERLNAIDEKLKKAYILPKSLGIIFGGFLILLISLIGYLSFKLMESKDDKLENDQMIKEEPTVIYDRCFYENFKDEGRVQIIGF